MLICTMVILPQAQRFKWSQMLSLQISRAVPTAAAAAMKAQTNSGRKTETNTQFHKSQNPKRGLFVFFCIRLSSLSPLLSSPVSVNAACTITTPITIATKNMHKVVAHSNMIKWCVVWRHSQHLSHPSLCSVSPSCTKANTHTHADRFPFPEPCFENRSFILTVNSQADRYSLTIRSTVEKKKPPRWISARYTCCCGSVSQRWSVANHPKHTHEECRITCVRRIRWHYGEQTLILLFWGLEEVFRAFTEIKPAAPQCKNTALNVVADQSGATFN